MSEPLSPNELACIAALLVPGTIADAAARAGVDERTLRRYLERVEFKRVLREAQSAAVMASASALADACSSAVASLKAVLSDREAPHAAQVSAARTILQFASEAIVDADIAARIEVLEAAAKVGK